MHLTRSSTNFIQGEPDAIMRAMINIGRKAQEEIDNAKAFWKTSGGYKQRMEWIYLYDGEYLPSQSIQDCTDLFCYLNKQRYPHPN